MNCRFCGTITTEVLDLHHQPLSNAFLTEKQLNCPEVYYPLRVYVCPNCWLMQVPAAADAHEIFGADYPYFSSQSPSNVSHAKELVEMAMRRFDLTMESQIIEIGANDGYLLKHFPEGFRVLGVDPVEAAAALANEEGIPMVTEFFSSDVAKLLPKADFLCGINVIAHQPDISDFVRGVRITLKVDGVAIFEFPHLMKLIDGNQFDTIYHEHFNYFSLTTIRKIFTANGLKIFHVEEIPEHGGSLRIYAMHRSPACPPTSPAVHVLLARERAAGMGAICYYTTFRARVENVRLDLMSSLYHARRMGLSIAAYGAAAKGNTLLNYCGIRPYLIDFVVDRSPYKQGKFLPGSHIPVVDESVLKDRKPKVVLILPWNIKEEVMAQLDYIQDWKGQFMVAIPKMEVTFSWTR